MTRRPIVLLVDDDAADQELARRAFEQSEIQVDLRTVSDGETALDYLTSRGAYADATSAPRPDLVLLDLNMPGLDGYRVLRMIRGGEGPLRRLPVIVMSTTTNSDDVNLSYTLGCNAFIRKPADFDDLVGVVRALTPYWFRLVELPRS